MNTLDPKYVIVQPDRPGALAFPVLLPAFVEHSVAAALGKPVSAGRCSITDAGVEAYGSSFSLTLNARPELDAKIIATWFAQRPPAQAAAAPHSEVCKP